MSRVLSANGVDLSTPEHVLRSSSRVHHLDSKGLLCLLDERLGERKGRWLGSACFNWRKGGSGGGGLMTGVNSQLGHLAD